MFDVGFWELVMVGVVSLLVFGPERLPRVAREAALWIRKARSMVASVKAEINHELQIQELRESVLEEKRRIERDAHMIGGKKPIPSLPSRSSDLSADSPPASCPADEQE